MGARKSFSTLTMLPAPWAAHEWCWCRPRVVVLLCESEVVLRCAVLLGVPDHAADTFDQLVQRPSALRGEDAGEDVAVDIGPDGPPQCAQLAEYAGLLGFVDIDTGELAVPVLQAGITTDVTASPIGRGAATCCTGMHGAPLLCWEQVVLLYHNIASGLLTLTRASLIVGD